MSRVGKMPIRVPDGVTVELSPGLVSVAGPLGQLACAVPKEMNVELTDGQIIVTRPSDNREHRSLHGLTRSLVANLVQGVTAGFKRELELVGTGYRASKSGDKLVMTLGYSHPVEMIPPEGISFEVPSPTSVVVKGCDKQLVGEVAAKVRSKRPPEPYLGKGIRYAGEAVRRKVGKTGK